MGIQSARAFKYVQDFSCIAERCEDNCCKGNWRIAVSNRSHDLYSREFPELLNLIVKDDSGYQMDKAGGQCGALQGGRCQIHAQQGEAVLTDTCANYPRMYRRINNSLVKSATMSCPEVARIGLFGESPFQIEEGPQDDHHLYAAANQEFPGIDPTQWRSVMESLLQITLSKKLPVSQVLLRLYDISTQLSELPHARWIEEIPLLADNTSNLQEDTSEPILADPLLIVLINVLNSPGAPSSLRQQLLTSSLIVPGATPAQAQWTLRSEYRRLYTEKLQHSLDLILKRFIAAEMTRTGFPFISNTSAGQDYGLSLTEWATTLAIRTLTLRNLLIAHCDVNNQLAPDKQQTVDLVYRFCRAASHNAVTAAERTLRNAITQRGLAYLKTLINQVDA
ncbi:flagellin lysine-N-methylase [Pseudomonas capsici]|uniref:Flagellin lysine-N-methylase n=1 Tax=Pseudomonas capsici TaxID=2810614 RepID=A0ABT3BUH9_9PSED|nr:MULTISPECIES: flagellin lysine-N-methylase [Pseudomonas]MBN6714404.1 flagellin lysine-N-methylase [Pseudomonas capsici]MBN6719649.1 flagellin lysine-N-methylase [Pseudomonas capsici]MBN6724011.1 flagellin lysine-N-methylase [Pseudomonas capsici]MBX8474091.1 flagellin lysine-N-methylase [Pseudomonas cichorii]MCV4263434.1 flagellin lysine-N-methylase [Pseudomonas capsici]